MPTKLDKTVLEEARNNLIGLKSRDSSIENSDINAYDLEKHNKNSFELIDYLIKMLNEEDIDAVAFYNFIVKLAKKRDLRYLWINSDSFELTEKLSLSAEQEEILEKCSEDLTDIISSLQDFLQYLDPIFPALVLEKYSLSNNLQSKSAIWHVLALMNQAVRDLLNSEKISEKEFLKLTRYQCEALENGTIQELLSTGQLLVSELTKLSEHHVAPLKNLGIQELLWAKTITLQHIFSCDQNQSVALLFPEIQKALFEETLKMGDFLTFTSEKIGEFCSLKVHFNSQLMPGLLRYGLSLPNKALDKPILSASEVRNSFNVPGFNSSH